MESGFKDDFADVRVHTDSRAAASSQALGANAFATGNDIYFAAGKYAPGSQQGNRLLAHELTHTIQQRGHAPSLARQSNATGDLTIDPDDSLEQEADRVAEQVVSSAPGEAGADRIALSRASQGPAIQRDVAPPVDDATRTSREQRAAEAIRRRDYRRLAEHDRPLESDFDFEPLGDPNHVAQLAGHPRLDDLSDYQKLRLFVSGDDELVSIPVRFADLAWGTIMVRRDDEGLSTPYPTVIRLDHPGLPSLDESHIPALLVEVDNDVVSGEIVTVSNQLSMGPPGSGYHRIGIADVPRVMALEDLQNLQIGAVENKLDAGRLSLHVNGMSFDLDGVFPGHGHFELDDASQNLTADAEIAAKGVTKKMVSIRRDALGDLSATAELTETLTPKPGHTLSGTLEARFLRGVFDIRGTLVYKSPTVNGEVTVLVTDAASAWQEVRARLGDKAPPVTASADAPHGLVPVGWGSLDFRLSEWLTGEAEVIVDPDGYVTAMGHLAPTKTIELFKQRSERRTLFDHDIPGEVGVGATLGVHASVGPGVLGDIVIDGYFTTYDRPENERPNEFSVRGVLAVPAVAGADLTVRGFVHVGIWGLRIGTHIEAKGSAEMQAYATAEPHIGRTRRADGSPGYFIRGRLTAGAALFLGLTGGLVIETPWPLPDVTAVSFGERRWRIGGATASVHGTYFLGDDQAPKLDYDIASGFNPSALVRSLLYHRDSVPTGGATAQNQTEHWDEDLTAAELEPARPTPALPSGDTPIDVETPTLAQHQLPASTEVEESANAPLSAPPAPVATPATPVAPAAPVAAPTPTTGGPAPAPVTPAPIPATPTPAPAASGPQALVVTFSMQSHNHALFLRDENVPRIWMESLRSPLGQRIMDTIAIVESELAAARASGVSASGRSVTDLDTELQMLESIRVRANQVESDAFSRSHDVGRGIPRDTPNYERIPHSPGLPSLAAEISAYAALCGRADLGAAEAANRPPSVARPVPIADAAVRTELVRFGVENPQRVIDNLTALPAGPEVERIIVSGIFHASPNYDVVLSQLQVPSQIASTLTCLLAGERIHNAGFSVWFEIQGPGRRGGPGFFDVDVAAVDAATGTIEQALAVKRFRGLDALRGNLDDAGVQLRSVAGARERWAVMHVGHGTSAELHSDYIGVVREFRRRYPGIQVRVFYPDGGSEDF